jgi:23S rRNA (guanosine2251-2'-O)-methyltransferase
MRKLEVNELNRLSVADFRSADKFPYVLVLDSVRSMHNVGSVFRTADAFRVKKIYLCGITGTPPHREISKTALGADESVAWEYHASVSDLAEHLRQDGYVLVAVEQIESSVSLLSFEPTQGQAYAFFFGNEVFGLDPSVVQLADIHLEIPQYGTKHSLNIAVSAGIICWDFISKAIPPTP